MISGFSKSRHAVVRIFVEQGGDDLAGEVAVFGEVVALLHLLGALLAGERLLLVGDVADQVEGIEGRADLLIQGGEDDAAAAPSSSTMARFLSACFQDVRKASSEA